MANDAPPDGGALYEYRLKQLEDRVGKQAQDIADLKAKVDNRERERLQTERNRLWTWIITLVTLLVTIAGSIIGYLAKGFPGAGQ